MDRVTEKIEIDLLVSAVLACSGYDFREYARASLRRRFLEFTEEMEVDSISALIPMVLHNREILNRLLFSMSITVTEMFRDPEVFRNLREKVIPYLKTFPFVRIWLAGCATGEEAYSLAIVLQEEELYDRCQIYATDFNDVALAHAGEGIYPLGRMKSYSSNYVAGGGKRTLSEYFHSDYDSAIMDRSLKKNITFANHNLAVDAAFGEMNLVMCRNVLIYFNQTLQERALHLFHDTLVMNGFLCLGTKETVRCSTVGECFAPLADRCKIFKKVK